MFHIHFFLFLLLQISPLKLITSSEYSLPREFFINCGSKSGTNFTNNRAFVGDESDRTGKLSYGRSLSVKNGNASSDMPLLYQTARVYTRPTSFELEIAKTGTYIVRLHFFPFETPSFNLSDAEFNVSASGFSLLSGFSTKRARNSLPVVEFLLSISKGKIGIFFVPVNASFAFVNAIEVFLTPENLLTDSVSLLTSSVSNASFQGVLSLVLKTVYRVNVGGPSMSPDNDTLWRTWAKDDSFLTGSSDFAVSKFHSAKLAYDSGTSSPYIAPDNVYKTARFANGSNSSTTWGFAIDESVLRLLIRIHFCDIINPAIDRFTFTLLFDGKVERIVNPYEETVDVAAPFYFDFVLDSNRSSFVNVSVANPRAFLNGIEIFEIRNVSGSIPPPNRTAKKSRTALIIGSVLGALVAGILIVALLVFKCRSATIDRSSGLFSGTQGSSAMSKIPPNLSLKISFAEIQKATGNFDKEFIIGEGGFGKVYRGILDGVKVAVKRSKAGHGQGFAEFKTEIFVLSQIRHRHLVSLIGYCDDGSEMILVYEFMENGTLQDHLYNKKDEPRKSEFSWEKRLEICIGAARGLDYLHSDAAKGILHRDVKSTNILLDENLEARVADFGLSKTRTADDLAEESYAVKGSFGYFDPEYVRSMQYTEKSDVYSFGVVLLETICARPAIFDLSDEKRSVSLAKWGMAWHREGKFESIIDPSLVGEISVESLRVFANLAVTCLNESGANRPPMKDVVWSLSYALRLQQSAARGESYEESTTNASLESAFPAIRRAAFGFGDDDSVTEMSGFSNTLRL